MTTLSYWNSLLVLILFLPLNTNTSMENGTNQELINSAKNIAQQLKSIQKHCKENNVDLENFLSKKEYKDYRTSLAFVKKYLPEIKADASTLKTKNTEKPTKDIEKTPFVEALVKWKKLIEGTFTALSTEYKDVQVDPIVFGDALGSSTIPIVNSLLVDWKNLAKGLNQDSVTLPILFNELLKGKTFQSFTVANEKNLIKIYRKAQNKYKELENDIEKFQTDVLPNKALFIAAIKASTDPKDKNLPDNVKAKAEANKTKAEAYQKVLDAWKAEEVANLSYESGDDTIYVDMSMINTGDPRVSVHNLPIELKSSLLTAILDEAKKANSRKQSVKNLKNIAIGAVTTFHRENINESKNYASLSLEEVRAINFPTNISGWILNYQVSDKAADPKVKEYETILENWRQEERASLDSSNASEHLIIDPVSLNINSNLVSHTGIPDQIRKDFLVAIKTELIQVEKQEGILNFNRAATLARNQIEAFARDYNIDNTLFDYKKLEVEEIRKLEFPSGIHGWLKDAEALGSKDDIKKEIKTQLDITLNNDIKFNLEALIKELKIDMGGITINNDFNFDNDMNLTYNSLDLILKELIEINETKKRTQESKTKEKTRSAELVIKDFYASYYDSCYYGGSLKLFLKSKKLSDGVYTLTFDKKIEIEKPNASLLNLYEAVLETVPSVKLKKKEQVVVKIKFALTYKYNKQTSISKTRENAYTIIEAGGNVGAEVSIRFAKLYAGADFKQINVPEKEGGSSTQGATDKTFTDYYTFEIIIENTEGGIELSGGADISFADSNYTRIPPQLKEKIGLCGNIELQE